MFDSIYASCESNVKLIRTIAIQFLQLTYRPAGIDAGVDDPLSCCADCLQGLVVHARYNNDEMKLISYRN